MSIVCSHGVDHGDDMKKPLVYYLTVRVQDLTEPAAASKPSCFLLAASLTSKWMSQLVESVHAVLLQPPHVSPS